MAIRKDHDWPLTTATNEDISGGRMGQQPTGSRGNAVLWIHQVQETPFRVQHNQNTFPEKQIPSAVPIDGEIYGSAGIEAAPGPPWKAPCPGKNWPA